MESIWIDKIATYGYTVIVLCMTYTATDFALSDFANSHVHVGQLPPPDGLFIIDRKSTNVTIGWSVSGCRGGHTLTSFTIEYQRTLNTNNFFPILNVRDVNPNRRNFTITDLDSNVFYSFRVQVLNENLTSSAYSLPISISTLPPGSHIRGFSVSPMHTNSCQLLTNVQLHQLQGMLLLLWLPLKLWRWGGGCQQHPMESSPSTQSMLFPLYLLTIQLTACHEQSKQWVKLTVHINHFIIRTQECMLILATAYYTRITHFPLPLLLPSPAMHISGTGIPRCNHCW